MASSKLKVVFLVGADNASTRRNIEAVCQLQDVEPVGILIDKKSTSAGDNQGSTTDAARSGGWSRPFKTILEKISSITTDAVNNAAVSSAAVDQVLSKAFPDECFCLAELGKKYRFRISTVGAMNSPKARQAIYECGADLGIVLGTGTIESNLLEVPRLGCIELQDGDGIGGGNRESARRQLFGGAASGNVSVRFMGERIGANGAIAKGAVAIHPMETPDSLEEKLNEEGAQVLARAVCLIRDEKVTRAQGEMIREESSIAEPDTAASNQAPLAHWKPSGAGITILRNLYVLFVYYSGLYFIVRAWHGLSRSRGAIILYHRVNDYSKDVLTVDRRTFAAQLLAISQRYPQTSTADLVEHIRSRKPLKPTTIAVHFDDCYQDIFTCGAPIMKALGVTGCAFINSGYIDTNRDFPHDLAYPFHYPMLSTADVKEWSAMGLEVGAHTVNHIDLGTSSVEAAREELVRCREELETILGKPVGFFAFPFGRPKNIREETKRLIPATGYRANFSANGGYIDAETDPYDIPRGGAHYESSPVYCMLQIEGLTLSRLARKLKSRRSSAPQVAMRP